MAMSGSDRSSRRSVWRQIVDQQLESGLSVKAFCAEKGVPVASFYQWKRKLKTASTGIAVVPVKIVGTEPTRPTSRFVHISTPSGFALRVDSSLPHDVLVELLRCIESCGERGDVC
jgi:hypothetical protein